MDPLLQFVTQPLVIVLIAIGVFVGRVVYLAKRLRSASKHLTLADMRALDEAKRSLDKHRESLEEAKGTLTQNLGGARDTLRGYKRPLNKAVDDRRQELETSIKGLAPGKELEKIRKQSAFSDAKRLYKTALPRKTHRSPAKEM